MTFIALEAFSKKQMFWHYCNHVGSISQEINILILLSNSDLAIICDFKKIPEEKYYECISLQ
jgi:hypothetical protein